MSIDPKSKAWESPYVSMGNNPIWFNDQLGDDYGIKIRKKDNKIKSVTLQATVYIQGDGASDKRAKELNKSAKNTFKTETVEGVEVNVKINYIFDSSKKPEDLNLGENLLTFKKEEGRSNVPAYPNQTGNTGTIFGSGKSTYTILHESLHLAGLSDRYTDNAKGGATPHKGYANDIMGAHGEMTLSISHYKNILNFARAEDKSPNYLVKHYDHPSQFIFGIKRIDTDKDDKLIK